MGQKDKTGTQSRQTEGSQSNLRLGKGCASSTELFWAWTRETGRLVWIKVAEGTYDECRQAITRHAIEQRWQNVDSLLTPVGTDANRRPRP